MSSLHGFSWVEKPLLSASAFPIDEDELRFLREQGIDILLTLTEDCVPRKSVDAAGLMSVHVPIGDMQPPTQEQLEQCLAIIEKARETKMGVNVHCLYGRGRTGTILGAYFISQGMSSTEAIQKVRELRPGSIETLRQEEALHEFSRRRRDSGG
jgi:atypical dual specificity phosphatase